MIKTKVYINAAPDLLARISFDRVRFDTLENLDQAPADNSVAVVINDAELENNLALVCALESPVLVLAGSMSAFGKNAYMTAIDCGVQEAGIIYKHGAVLRNHVGHQFASLVKAGVGPWAILELAKYAVQQNLVPDMVVLWNPEDDTESQQIERLVECPENKTSGSFVQMELKDFLSQARQTVLAIRTVPSSDRTGIAGKIALFAQALHLEISNQPGSFQIHQADNPDQAVMAGLYAFSDGYSVQTTNSTRINGPVVIEMEPAELPPVLLDQLHSKADFVIHIADRFETCRCLIEDWLEAGGRLDAIVPVNEDERALYEKQYPGLIKDIEGISKLLSNP